MQPDDEARLREPSADPLRAPLDEDEIIVVGIGASAGGINTLEQFFEAAPSEPGMAFVVVLHLDPERDSQIDEILGRKAPFPAIQVTEPVDIEPDRVYVIAPHTQLEIEGDRLVPRSMPEQRPRNPVDAFFRSLSDHRGSSAVGVVLSGTGDDGTLGLRFIREKGGLTVAQDPDQATYSGMPRSAVSSSSVELVLPASAIASRLVEIRNADGLGIREVDEGDLHAAEESDVGRIVAALTRETERNFEGYKRSTFLRRVDRRMKFNQVDDLEKYARLVETDPEECRALFKDLLISVSRFFRNHESWEALEDRVVPELFDGKGPEESVRVWVPGCATGEEAYSVAMLLHEHAAGLDHSPEIQVFGTDIDEEALQFARKAVFPESIEDEVGEKRIDRFFVLDEDRYTLVRQVRESVLFASHDLLAAPPFSRLDLVCCRNLLIYLKPDAQRAAVQRMHYGLHEGGYLFVGASESVNGKHFESVATKHRIYRRKPGTPSLPLSDQRVSSPSMTPRTERRTTRRGGDDRSALRDLHSKLLAEVGLPSMMVNDEYEIVHISKGAGVYLQHGEGKLTDDVLELVSEPVELELRTALFQAFHDREASRHSVTTEVDGRTRRLDLEVRPGPEGGPLDGFALVVFNERSEEEIEADGGDHPESARDRIIKDLKEELRKTRQHLRTTLEEREATIEELQSANEELQSINEEQQATSEELEARREELQSMNEELSTINEEHRRKIEELDEVNADLRNLMASTEIPTVFLNRDLEVRRFTSFAAEIFNLKPQDEGRDFSDITHRLEGVGDLTGECRTVLQSGETVETEARTEDGRWYNVRMHPYRATGDTVAGVVITLYDLTERKRFEDELREAKIYAEQIVDTLHEPLLVLTPDLRVKTANPAFYEHFEAIPDETTGKLIYELGNGQWDIPILRELLEDVLPDDESFTDFEVEHDFEHIGRRVMLLNGRRLQRTQLILLGIRDITERRREREERHAAEAANRAKTDFMATVSHELRTPLNAIIGYTELVLEGVPSKAPQEVKEQVTRISHAAHHLRELISEVLSFSRVEADRETLELGDVSLPDLVDEIRAVVEPLAEEAGLDLRLDADDAPEEIHTDSRKLRQILLNLLGNAVKFTEEGRVSLRVSERDGEILFQVSDTGRGIDPDQQERLFEPFWQGPQGKPLTFEGGTGLGLTISKRFADILDGDISLESTPGEGSTFTLRLPS